MRPDNIAVMKISNETDEMTILIPVIEKTKPNRVSSLTYRFLNALPSAPLVAYLSYSCSVSGVLYVRYCRRHPQLHQSPSYVAGEI